MDSVSPPLVQSDYLHQISTLQALQSSLESQEKYLEAESINHQIQQLIEDSKIALNRELELRQNSEKMELESAHDSEFAEFRAEWENRLVEYRENARKVEEELKKRQGKEREKRIQEYAAGLPTQPKPSVKLLEARKMKESLIKGKKYKEVHDITQKITDLELKDNEKFLLSTQEKIEQMRRTIQAKQSLEFNSLHLKHDIGFKELLRQRELALERLTKRFKNSTSTLANCQGIVKMRSETRLGKAGNSKQIERILMSAKSAATSPRQSPKSKSSAASRGSSPRLGDIERRW